MSLSAAVHEGVQGKVHDAVVHYSIEVSVPGAQAPWFVDRRFNDFNTLHSALKTDGRLTLLSDNGRYCRALCATLGALRAPTGPAGTSRAPLLFACEEEHTASFETVCGLRLYHGVPGSECGHLQAETSYFDRLWEYRQGNETERFFLALKRV